MIKPYIITKKITFCLIAVAITCVAATGALYFLNLSKSSADSTSYLEVVVQPSTNQAAADAHTEINVDMALNLGSTTVSTDHVSLFATKAGTTFNPSRDTAGAQEICTAASVARRNDPLNLVGSSSCDSSGRCDSITWTAPSTTGAHQLFAVAMSSPPSVACSPSNIIGWSVLKDSQMINIYTGRVSTGNLIVTSYPDQAALNTDFRIRVQVRNNNPTGNNLEAKMDHISVLVSSNDSVNTPITNQYVCEQANLRSDTGRKLFTFAQYELYYPDGSIMDSDDYQTTLRLSTSGDHRIVVVGGYDIEAACSAETGRANIVEINSAGIVKVVSATDPAGTAGGTGGGGSGGGGSGGGTGGGGSGGSTGSTPTYPNLQDPTHLESITDLINRYIILVWEIAGSIAFTALLFAGFTMMTSGGNPDKANRAKKAIMYALISLIILFAAGEIVRIVVDIINNRRIF